jgi:hypothetical protein
MRTVPPADAISAFLGRALRRLRSAEDRPAAKEPPAGIRALPLLARVFVGSVIVIAAVTGVADASRQWPDLRLFIPLLLGSVIASSMKLKLPVGAGSSNLSISYTFDFATLLLLGTGPASVVAACSALAQSRIATAKHNPTYRVLFNMAALVLTVQAAGLTFSFFGGQAGTVDLFALAKPLVATALAYYLANSAIVATAVALSSGDAPWKVWHTNFLWTAPSYFVGAGAAAAGIALLRTEHGWFVPLLGAPVYLTFRSYRMYLDRIRYEKQHNEEVLRLLDAAAAIRAALCVGRGRFQRRTVGLGHPERHALLLGSVEADVRSRARYASLHVPGMAPVRRRRRSRGPAESAGSASGRREPAFRARIPGATREHRAQVRPLSWHCRS